MKGHREGKVALLGLLKTPSLRPKDHSLGVSTVQRAWGAWRKGPPAQPWPHVDSHHMTPSAPCAGLLASSPFMLFLSLPSPSLPLLPSIPLSSNPLGLPAVSSALGSPLSCLEVSSPFVSHPMPFTYPWTKPAGSCAPSCHAPVTPHLDISCWPESLHTSWGAQS